VSSTLSVNAIRVIRNSLFLFASQTLLLVSNLGLYVLVGRKLGPEGFGQYAFVLAFIGLFTFLPDLGVNLYLLREIARRPKEVRFLLGIAFTLVLLLTPMTCALIIVISNLLRLDQIILNSMYLACVYLVLASFLSLFRAAFHAYEQMGFETYAVLTERIIAISVSTLVLFFNGGLLSLLGALIFAKACALLVSGAIFVTRIGPLPSLYFEKMTSFEVLKASLPFALNILTTTIYVQADLVLLKIFVGDEASGFYKAATSLIIPLAVIATSLNSAMFPGLARAYAKSLDFLHPLVETSVRYLFILGWPISLGILILAPQIILLFYGREFERSILPFQILAFLVFMRFINNTLGVSLTAIDRQGIRASIILFSALLNLVLNLIFIPRWSYLGASIITLLTEVFISVSLYTAINRYLGKINLWQLLHRVFFSGLVMVSITYILRGKSFALVVIVSALSYVITLILFRAFPKKDILRLKHALQGSS
jgi:O-antigen/teichoic acid export membrane protein